MESKQTINHLKPSKAFVLASWSALAIGLISYLLGLWNSDLQLNEKGYYFAVLLLGLYAAISVQKTVRDKEEGLPVTHMYYLISWSVAIGGIALLVIGLYNAEMWLSEKGFFGMAYTLALFAAIAVQKNTRDLEMFKSNEESIHVDDNFETDDIASQS